jgi:hypothetical protein
MSTPGWAVWPAVVTESAAIVEPGASSNFRTRRDRSPC